MSLLESMIPVAVLLILLGAVRTIKGYREAEAKRKAARDRREARTWPFGRPIEDRMDAWGSSEKVPDVGQMH